MRTAARLLAAALLALGPAPAAATLLTFRSTVRDGQKTDLVQEVKLQGDLRLRHDSTMRRTAPNVQRDRQRLRLRYGMDATLLNDMTAGFALASGTGEQVSTNQSMDNLGGQKSIWIDKVYLKWAPKLSDDGKLSVSAGRIANPLWQTYSSDIVWDSDFNPEGLGQSVEWYLPSLGGIYFANALQMAADEDSDSRADQYMLGGQLGAEYRLPAGSRLRFAGALYEWTNSRINDFSPAAAQNGNRRLGNRVLNDFKVAELTAQLSGWAGPVPVKLQGTFIRNLAAIQEEQAGRGEQGRNQAGYQVGAIVGEAADPKSWEAGYFYKWSESDATVADVADSDFGNGGTNRKGHIFWTAYSPNDWSQLKFKFFYTTLIANGLPPGSVTAAANPANKGDDINRILLDYVVKF